VVDHRRYGRSGVGASGNALVLVDDAAEDIAQHSHASPVLGRPQPHTAPGPADRHLDLPPAPHAATWANASELEAVPAKGSELSAGAPVK
jgi:hypothetical protein